MFYIDREIDKKEKPKKSKCLACWFLDCRCKSGLKTKNDKLKVRK